MRDLLLLVSLAIQANDALALIVADIISSKAPPLPKEVAEDLLNENKNRLVRAAINASRSYPVLATALENAFTEALSKAESNASYNTVLHRRRIMTLCAIVIDDVTNGQVKGEDVWNVKVVQEHAHRPLYVLVRAFEFLSDRLLTQCIGTRSPRTRRQNSHQGSNPPRPLCRFHLLRRTIHLRRQ